MPEFMLIILLFQGQIEYGLSLPIHVDYGSCSC
ncbi:hypothetical protein CCACVL1_01806, partial [Corchorus capsularis]